MNNYKYKRFDINLKAIIDYLFGTLQKKIWTITLDKYLKVASLK